MVHKTSLNKFQIHTITKRTTFHFWTLYKYFSDVHSARIWTSSSKDAINSLVMRDSFVVLMWYDQATIFTHDEFLHLSSFTTELLINSMHYCIFLKHAPLSSHAAGSLACTIQFPWSVVISSIWWQFCSFPTFLINTHKSFFPQLSRVYFNYIKQNQKKKKKSCLMPELNCLASVALCRLQFSTHLLRRRQQVYLSRQTSLIQSSHTAAGILLRICCHMPWCICIVPLQLQTICQTFGVFWKCLSLNILAKWKVIHSSVSWQPVVVFSNNREADIYLIWRIWQGRSVHVYIHLHAYCFASYD